MCIRLGREDTQSLMTAISGGLGMGGSAFHALYFHNICVSVHYFRHQKIQRANERSCLAGGPRPGQRGGRRKMQVCGPGGRDHGTCATKLKPGYDGLLTNVFAHQQTRTTKQGRASRQHPKYDWPLPRMMASTLATPFSGHSAPG